MRQLRLLPRVLLRPHGDHLLPGAHVGTLVPLVPRGGTGPGKGPLIPSPDHRPARPHASRPCTWLGEKIRPKSVGPNPKVAFMSVPFKSSVVSPRLDSQPPRPPLGHDLRRAPLTISFRLLTPTGHYSRAERSTVRQTFFRYNSKDLVPLGGHRGYVREMRGTVQLHRPKEELVRLIIPELPYFGKGYSWEGPFFHEFVPSEAQGLPDCYLSNNARA